MALINHYKDNDTYISTWRHRSPLPSMLEGCSIEDFETILQLSSSALKSLHEQTSSLQFQYILNKKISEITEKNNSEIVRAKKEYETKVQQLNNTHSNSEFAIQQKSSNEIQILKSKVSELQISLEQSIKSYQILNQNFVSLQTTSNQSLEKNLSTILEKQKCVYQEQLIMQEKIYKEQIHGLKASLDNLTQNTIQQNNSSIKGKMGESSFDTLVQQYTTWDIEDTSKIPQSCDRLGKIRGCKTLFEIKNYGYNIPKKEVDKFKRDLEVHKDSPLGIFISLNTNIVGGQQEFLYTEFTNSNQLLIYIQQFNNQDPSTIFSILDAFVDIALLFYNKTSNNIEDVSVQNKIDSIKPILQNELTNLFTIMNELTNNKKFLTETITKHYNSIKHHIDRVRFSFESIFKTFFEENTLNTMTIDEPVSLKKARGKRNMSPAQNNQVILDVSSSCGNVQNAST